MILWEDEESGPAEAVAPVASDPDTVGAPGEPLPLRVETGVPGMVFRLGAEVRRISARPAGAEALLGLGLALLPLLHGLAA